MSLHHALLAQPHFFENQTSIGIWIQTRTCTVWMSEIFNDYVCRPTSWLCVVSLLHITLWDCAALISVCTWVTRPHTLTKIFVWSQQKKPEPKVWKMQISNSKFDFSVVLVPSCVCSCAWKSVVDMIKFIITRYTTPIESTGPDDGEKMSRLTKVMDPLMQGNAIIYIYKHVRFQTYSIIEEWASALRGLPNLLYLQVDSLCLDTNP